tara:strand:- start:1318 stop:2595 length:1278 start_codon:yes stop_codon:yes gene_type:complete
MATEQDVSIHPANRAAHLYLSGTTQATRRADQFFVVFNLYPLVNDDFLNPKYGYLRTVRDRLHFLCHTAEGPKFQIQQDVMNQYNRKRVINRKIDYDPMSVRMYDTVDGLGLKFAKMLYEFEFQNARLYTPKGHPADGPGGPNRDNYQESVLTNENQFRRTHNFGMIAQENHSHRLIKSIDLYQLQGKLYSRATMIHPRLTRMDMDQFDYSSSAITNISLSFQYENLMFDDVAVNYKDRAPADVKSAFDESTGRYEDWVRTWQVTESEDPPKEYSSEGATEQQKGVHADYKEGESVYNQTADDGVYPILGNESATADDGFDMTKSVTSKFAMADAVTSDDGFAATAENTYQSATSSLHSETNSLATNKTLSSSELTSQMKKFVENGPANNSNEAKKAFKQKIQTFEQAITNKKKDESNNTQGIWT